MTVELVPNENSESFCMGLANGTWFTLCNGPLKTFLGEQHTNDPMNVDAITADLCGDALDLWKPPKGWFSHGNEDKGKALIKKFFKTCNGFTTY